MTINRRSTRPQQCFISDNHNFLRRFIDNDSGAATAEYAVATMAAVGFASLLVVILRGDEVRGILTDLIRNALSIG
jgi:Flp pilus assembly pilin Flp